MTRAACLLLLLAGCAGGDAGRRVIATDGAPRAIGPYSQAIESGGFVFLAGQIAIDPATQQMVAGGIEAQTERVLLN